MRTDPQQLRLKATVWHIVFFPPQSGLLLLLDSVCLRRQFLFVARLSRLLRRCFGSGSKADKPVGAYSVGGTPPDPTLVQRIKCAYEASMQKWLGPGNSTWAEIGDRHSVIRRALLADDDALKAILTDPGQTDLFYGFDNLCCSIEKRNNKNRKRRPLLAVVSKRQIIRLGEAMGVRGVPNPEGGPIHTRAKTSATAEVEATLADLDTVFGFRIEFPNPYPNEFGMPTSRGIATYRATQALYQVFRLLQLTREFGPRIIEIGAGMGRTAGYAHRLGLSQYTIVDLPMANVAQASFLGQTLGPQSITLASEEPRAGAIRIVTPEWLRGCGETFDVVLNVDSMTEMDRKFADEYAAWIQANATCFLSVNHDLNTFRVCDLAPLKRMSRRRFPYWMRDGYTEEIYVNAQTK
ncbi:MAG TPA: putative sugar O-methyltransferase [Verrucomicrobiae bacterium]|nr:putative sugar O-methyltransferase [Verrucomicrobiae bacterium]